jgi:2'-5' RNA ligase
MMLYVLAYPTLPLLDLGLIQDLRTRYDARMARLVAAHFTLVFPQDLLGPEALVSHVREQAARLRPLTFALRCAIPFYEAAEGITRLYLVPDEGLSAIVRLHDRLYEGPLADALRPDVPFVPHITIGQFEDPEAARQAAAEINRAGLYMAGGIGDLTILDIDGLSVTEVATISLTGPLSETETDEQ